MRMRNALAMTTTGLALIVLLAMASGAQEPARPETPAKTETPPARKAINPTRRVPYYFGQLGLTPDQRESIYKIVAKHQSKIDALQRQVNESRAQMVTECEGVLTDTQKQLLDSRRRANPRAQARTAAPAAPAPTSAPAPSSAPAPPSAPASSNTNSPGSSD